MIENAAQQGARFLDDLKSLRTNTIREVRGRGLMLVHPEAGEARRYYEALQGGGILAKDTHGHTIRIIRIAPPLVISGDQVDWALEQIGAALRQNLS